MSLTTLLNKKNCTIQELSLAGNKMNCQGIKALAKFLPINKSLLRLDLGKNEFLDEDFEEFAKNVRENQTLRELDISRNKYISDEGSLITLIESMANNQSI